MTASHSPPLPPAGGAIIGAMMRHQIARTCLPIGGVVAVAMLAASATGQTAHN
jgi:hypothetical protein